MYRLVSLCIPVFLSIFVSLSYAQETAPVVPEPPPASSAQPPQITFPESSHDFGPVEEGDVATYNFVVKNTGGSRLVLERVNTSCGCTAALPQEHEIAPGDTTTIQVSFNSKGRTGQSVNKTVTVYSNDPENAQARLTITGSVAPRGAGLQILPPSWDAGVLSPESVKIKHFTLKNSGGSELVINKIDGGVNCTAVVDTLPLTIPPGETDKLEVTCQPKLAKGIINEKITIESNDPKNPRADISIMGYITPFPGGEGVTIIPAEKDFSKVAPSDSLSAQFRIKNNGSSTVSLSNSVTTLPGAEVQFSSRDIEPDQTATATLNLKAPSEPGKREGFIYLEVAIPVSLEVVDTGAAVSTESK
ncbi:MAG: DUF1573 domain-containing protein [bacterium]|nr:DUF1573 domain-containing protein [bacterium]